MEVTIKEVQRVEPISCHIRIRFELVLGDLYGSEQI
jgi:hypothetical protein